MQPEARLRAFAALARRGSFSAAAEELVISQPAVSKHVAELEREIGTKLVERSGRGVRLTEAGRFVADHVLRAEAILALAERGVASIGRELGGTLALGASGTGLYLLTPALRAFHVAHRGVDVRVESDTSVRIAEAVRAHALELAIVGGFTSAPELHVESLMEDEIVIVARPDVARGIKRARDLGELTWIAREEGSATRRVIEGAWSDLGIAPRHRIALPAWEGVKLAVAQGAGVAAISRIAIDLELASGTLVIVPLRDWKVRRHLSLVHPRDIPLSPPADRFIALLRATIRERPSSSAPSRRRRARTTRRI